MKLTGLHLLLTYQCTLACDHCFVWGSPRQSGTLTLERVHGILEQARATGTITSVCFEGGEPFLHYAVLLDSVRQAVQLGFRVGIVSNSYWATSLVNARERLRPFAGLLTDLSLSSDRYHWTARASLQIENARAAAAELGIPIGFIRVAQPESVNAAESFGQLPPGESAVMYRGRAARLLAARAIPHPWAQFDQCPHEDLREPGRLHIDPFGNAHLCDGILLGNLFQTPLVELCETYAPEEHPIAGPLLQGGPAELVRRYQVPHQVGYADACHLCYAARGALRERFPSLLGPGQMYGEPA